MMKVVGIWEDIVEVLSEGEILYYPLETFNKLYGEPTHGMVLK